MKRISTVLIAMLGAVSLFLVGSASAQSWPDRPVRIVTPFSPGGTADVLARMMAGHFTEAFQQQFIVDNRLGGAGLVGTQAVVSAPPDGYTLLLSNISLLSLHPSTILNLPYDPIKDLTNIAYVAGSPVVLTVTPKTELKSLKEFVKYAKKSEKPLTFSASGLGGAGHLVGELFAKEAGFKASFVPYKGAAQGVMDVVAGHLDFGLPVISTAAPQFQSNRLIALAHTAGKRMPDYPDIPTFKELGVDIVSTTWFSLSGPAKLPDDIVVKLNREVVNMISNPDLAKKMSTMGMLTDPMNPTEFREFILMEAARWKPVLQQAGVVIK